MNRTTLCAALCATIAFCGAVGAPAIAQQPTGPNVTRLDPSLDAVIAPNATLQVLTGNDFGITEGPVWVPQGQSGYLLFSDIVANVIYKWSPESRGYSVFLDNAGYRADSREALQSIAREGFIGRGGPRFSLFVYNFGSNGITLDPQGRIVYCAQGQRAIIRLERDGTRTVVADKYQGNALNSPNDIIVKSDGAIYFSDPHGIGPKLPYSAVFMVKDGTVHLLANNFDPNGLAFSPDEKTLYINGRFDVRPGQAGSGYPGIWQYDVRPDDTIANGRLFISMAGDKSPGGPDGMKVDRAGNVYDTGPGGIWVMSPQGKHIGTIVLPDNNVDRATNLAFGDPDYKTLYITDRLSLLRVRLNIAGIAPGPPQR